MDVADVAEAGGAAVRSKASIWWSAPSLLLLFLMLLVPTAHQPLKAALLLLAFFTALAAAFHRPERTVHRATLVWTLVLCATGLGFMARGLLRGEPGALSVGTVYVLWPLLFVALLAGAVDRGVLRRHVVVVVLATFAVAVYGLEFVLEQGGWIPRSVFPDLFPDQGVGFYEGFVELRIPSLATLTFTLPFLVAAAVSWTRAPRPLLARRWVWGALVAGLLLAALSGRRAILLVAALAPLFTLGGVALLPRSERSRLRGPTVLLLGGLFGAVAVVALFLGRAYGFDLALVWDMFREGFDPRASESSSIRAVQLHELIAGWSEHPWLGAGHGGFVRSHIRNPALPWSYELSYPTLLFQTGVVGFAAYAALFGWIYWQAARMIRAGGDAARLMLPLVVGLTTFLIANATNPYLLKFDFMWVVFLPLALINRWLIDRDADPVPQPA